MVGFWSAITQFHSTSPFSFWMVVTDSRCQCTEANFFHQQHLAIWQAALAFLLAASEQSNGSALLILPGKLIYLGGILINVLPYPYILCNRFLLINMPVNYLLIRFPQRYIFICSQRPVLNCSFLIHRLLWSQIQGTRIPASGCWGAGEAMQLILLNSPANLRETEGKWFQTDPNFKLHLFHQQNTPLLSVTSSWLKHSTWIKTFRTN